MAAEIRASQLRIVRRHVHAADVRIERLRVEPQTAIQAAQSRVNFSVIDQRDREIAALALPELAVIVARGVKRMLGSNDDLLALLNTDVNDIATVAMNGSDVGRIRTLIEQALAASWQLGAVTSSNELDKAGIASKHSKEVYASLRNRAAAYIEANGFRMAENVSEAVRSIIQDELLSGVKAGKSVETVRTAIWNRIVGRGLTSREAALATESDAAIIKALNELWVDDEERAAHYLNTLVRTNMMEAMNEARFAEFNDPITGGSIVALEYSAILDEVTTDLCRHMDGRVYAKDSPVWDKWRPPNHFNCRSIIIPITSKDGWDGVESPMPRIEPAVGFFDRSEFAWNPLQERWPEGTPVAGKAGGGRWRDMEDHGDVAHREAQRVSSKQKRPYDRVPDYGAKQIKGLTLAENNELHGYRQESESLNTPLRRGKNPESFKGVGLGSKAWMRRRIEDIVGGSDKWAKIDWEEFFPPHQFESKAARDAIWKKIAQLRKDIKKDGVKISDYGKIVDEIMAVSIGSGNPIKLIDSALSKASFPHNAVLFRGLRGTHDVWQGKVSGKDSLKIKEGSILHDRGYQSWSVDVKAATKFTSRMRPTYFVTGISKGDKAIALRYHSSHFNSEREVLLPRNRRYRVARIIEGKKYKSDYEHRRRPTFVFLEEIKSGKGK